MLVAMRWPGWTAGRIAGWQETDEADRKRLGALLGMESVDPGWPDIEIAAKTLRRRSEVLTQVQELHAGPPRYESKYNHDGVLITYRRIEGRGSCHSCYPQNRHCEGCLDDDEAEPYCSGILFGGICQTQGLLEGLP
jgi:hypothetical protein